MALFTSPRPPSSARPTGRLVFIDAPDPRWRRELAAVAELGGGEPERLAFYRALAPMIAQLPPSHQAELSVIEDLVTRGPLHHGRPIRTS